MNSEFAKTYLHLIQALAEDKTIQCNVGSAVKPEWENVSDPTFYAPVDYYRVKPEPKVRYALVYTDGSSTDFITVENAKKSIGTYKWAAIIKISVCPDTYETTVEVLEQNAPR